MGMNSPKKVKKPDRPPMDVQRLAIRKVQSTRPNIETSIKREKSSLLAYDSRKK